MCKCVQNLIENVPATPYGWLENGNTLCCICLRSCCFGLEKTQKMHFFPVLDLTSDSLTTIRVKPHQCPLLCPYAIDPGTNPWHFFEKILRIGGFEQLIFCVGHFDFFSQKKRFFCFIPIKSVKVSWVARMGRKLVQFTNQTIKSTFSIKFWTHLHKVLSWGLFCWVVRCTGSFLHWRYCGLS